MNKEQNWTDICKLADLVDNSGVCALVNGEQVAIFKVQTKDEAQFYAVMTMGPIPGRNQRIAG